MSESSDEGSRVVVTQALVHEEPRPRQPPPRRRRFPTPTPIPSENDILPASPIKRRPSLPPPLSHPKVKPRVIQDITLPLGAPPRLKIVAAPAVDSDVPASVSPPSPQPPRVRIVAEETLKERQQRIFQQEIPFLKKWYSVPSSDGDGVPPSQLIPLPRPGTRPPLLRPPMLWMRRVHQLPPPLPPPQSAPPRQPTPALPETSSTPPPSPIVHIASSSPPAQFDEDLTSFSSASENVRPAFGELETPPWSDNESASVDDESPESAAADDDDSLYVLNPRTVRLDYESGEDVMIRGDIDSVLILCHTLKPYRCHSVCKVHTQPAIHIVKNNKLTCYLNARHRQFRLMREPGFEHPRSEKSANANAL